MLKYTIQLKHGYDIYDIRKVHCFAFLLVLIDQENFTYFITVLTEPNEKKKLFLKIFLNIFIIC